MPRSGLLSWRLEQYLSLRKVFQKGGEPLAKPLNILCKMPLHTPELVRRIDQQHKRKDG